MQPDNPIIAKNTEFMMDPGQSSSSALGLLVW